MAKRHLILRCIFFYLLLQRSALFFLPKYPHKFKVLLIFLQSCIMNIDIWKMKEINIYISRGDLLEWCHIRFFWRGLKIAFLWHFMENSVNFGISYSNGHLFCWFHHLLLNLFRRKNAITLTENTGMAICFHPIITVKFLVIGAP